MDASAGQSPEQLAQAFEAQSSAPRSREDIAVPLLPEGDDRTPVLGNVKISLLVKNNPDTDFGDWLNTYSEKATQDEMREALTGVGSQASNVAKFLAELRSSNAQQTVAYAELKSLIEKTDARKDTYAEATQEADEFKRGLILDNVGAFLKREVVEGLQNEPIMTLVKTGLALFLIHKLYSTFISDNDTAKKWFWGGLSAAAGAYLLNGYIKDDKGRTGLEMAGLTPDIKNKELAWFCKEAGIDESRERTAMIMRLTDVKIDTLANLYSEGGGEIDVSELIDDPNLTDAEAEELDKMNTPSMRKSLYKTVGKLIELAGVSSPLELKTTYHGQPLLMVIFDLARKHKGITPAQIEVATSTNDRSLSEVLSNFSIEGIDLGVREERLWMNGYPFAYALEGGVLKIKDAQDPSKQLAEFSTSNPDTLKVGLETFYSTKHNVALKIKSLFETIYKPTTSGLIIAWDEAKNEWTIKGFRVPAMPALGIQSEMEIELGIYFSAKGALSVRPQGGRDDITPEDLEKQIVHAALIKRLKEDGPDFCRAKRIDIKEHDEAKKRIEAVVDGTPVVMTYKGNKYNLIEADWDKGSLIDYYKGGMETSASAALETAFEPLRYNGSDLLAGFNLISNWHGTDADEYHEFRTLYEMKPNEMGLLLSGIIRGLDQDGSDLDAKIAEKRQKLLDDVKSGLDDIAHRFNEFKTDPASKQVTEAEFNEQYIGQLQLAGMPSSYYRGKFKVLSDRLRSIDYASNDKFGPAYYNVKTQAFTYFFHETGDVSVKGDSEITAEDRKRVDDAYHRIDQALTASLEHGSFFDNTVWSDEFATLMSDEHAPSYANRPAPLTPPEASSVRPIGTIEINKVNLDNVDNSYAEFTRYATAHFDGLKGLVPYRAVFPGTTGERMALQWETLVDNKKSAYLASIDETTFKGTCDQYLTTASDPTEAISGFITGTTEDMVRSVKAIESTALSGFDEAKYLEMVADLIFIDGSDMYQGIAEDPALTTKVADLETRASAEYIAHQNSVEYQRLIGEIKGIVGGGSFAGRREAYRNYVAGTALTSLYDASLTTRDAFVAASTDRVTGIEAYTGSTWDQSDAALYGKAYSFESSLGENAPSQISAPYDVQAFMADIYKESIADVHTGSTLDIYIQSEQLEVDLAMHGEFLAAKKAFWTKVDGLALNTEISGEVAELEQSLHTVLSGLQDGSNDVARASKTTLYKSSLDLVTTILETSEDKDVDAKDVRSHIIEEGKKLGLTLDRNDVPIV